MNILVATNSFKECADSVEISTIICKKLQTNSSFKIISKPLSDGGDGFLNTCKLKFQTEPLNLIISNDLDSNEKEYTVQIDHFRKNVFIESAELFGLKLLDKHQRNPLVQNSEVLGMIIKKLADDVSSKKLDVRTIWIGVGGTATIDFGMGACAKLGLVFYNDTGNLIEPVPKNFNQIKKIKSAQTSLPFEIKCIVDVDTPLLAGPGAIEIYGHQKGASDDELKIIKSGIQNLLGLINADKELSLPKKLNGAGGGLASGLNIFFDAEIISAETFIKKFLLEDVNLDAIEAIITGEGSFDYQSFEGKGSGVILKLFKDKSIPIFLICGSINLPDNIKLSPNIIPINIANFFDRKEESIKNFRIGIAEAMEIVLNHFDK